MSVFDVLKNPNAYPYSTAGGLGSSGLSGLPGSSGSGMDWMGKFGQGAGIGGLLGGLFGNAFTKNPASAAMPYLNQIPGLLNQYYSPYVNAGLQSLGQLQGQYGNLINDPNALMSKIGGQFQASPGYQYNVDQATRAANQAAAAGGMTGSPAEQQALAKTVSGLASQDYNDYMNRALGLYGTGLEGLQGLNTQGFQASTDLGKSLAEALMSQAGLSYAGQANRNQSRGGLLGGVGGLLGGLGSLFF